MAWIALIISLSIFGNGHPVLGVIVSLFFITYFNWYDISLFLDDSNKFDDEIVNYNFNDTVDENNNYQLRNKLKLLNTYIDKFENNNYKKEEVEKAVLLIEIIEEKNYRSKILKIAKNFLEIKKYVTIMNKVNYYLEYIKNAEIQKNLNNKTNEKEYLIKILEEIEIKNILSTDIQYINNSTNFKIYSKDVVIKRLNLLENKDKNIIIKTLEESFSKQEKIFSHEINLLDKNMQRAMKKDKLVNSELSNKNKKYISDSLKYFDEIKGNYYFIKDNYNNIKVNNSLQKLNKKLTELNNTISKINEQFLYMYEDDNSNHIIGSFENLSNLLKAEEEIRNDLS